MGAFEVLLDLLAVHQLLPGGSRLAVGCTPHGWKPFTRRETVAALRLMFESSGSDPVPYALHSGRSGRATQLAAQGVARAAISARRQMEVARIHDGRAGGRGRGQNPSPLHSRYRGIIDDGLTYE